MGVKLAAGKQLAPRIIGDLRRIPCAGGIDDAARRKGLVIGLDAQPLAPAAPVAPVAPEAQQPGGWAPPAGDQTQVRPPQ